MYQICWILGLVDILLLSYILIALNEHIYVYILYNNKIFMYV